MKLFCCFTPAHEILYKTYFLPSVPPGFSVAPIEINIEGSGDFLSSEFLRCIDAKIGFIQQSLRDNLGDIIIWSDVDIQFFRLDVVKLISELGEHDIAFQREGSRVPDVNTGFFICRCNERVLEFFSIVKDKLKQMQGANEQYVINCLLQSGGNCHLSWAYLPLAYYARTHGWPPPRNLKLYHANATPGKNGIKKKIAQFRDLMVLRRFGLLGLILTSVKYAPKRVRRVLLSRIRLQIR